MTSRRGLTTRLAMVLATSSGPGNSRRDPLFMSVSMKPGETRETEMPLRSRSWRNDNEKPRKPNLVPE